MGWEPAAATWAGHGAAGRPLRLTPLFRTALFPGLRLGELLGLQWQDIDLHDGELQEWAVQR